MSNVQISVVYSGRGLPGRVRGLVRLGPARSERARSAGATRGGSPSDRRYGGRRGPGRRAPFQTRMRHAGSTTEPMVSRPRHEASCPGSRRRLSASSPSPMCVRGRSDSPGRRWVRSSDAGTAEVPGAPHLRGLSSVGRHRSPGGPGGRHVTTDYWGRIRRSRSETVRTSGPRADLDGSPSTGQLAVVVIPNAGNVLAIHLAPRPPVPPGATMPLSPEVHRPIRQSAIRMPAHDESVTGFVVSKPEVRAAEGKSRCVCLCLPERCDAGPCVARWLVGTCRESRSPPRTISSNESSLVGTVHLRLRAATPYGHPVKVRGGQRETRASGGPGDRPRWCIGLPQYLSPLQHCPHLIFTKLRHDCGHGRTS